MLPGVGLETTRKKRLHGQLSFLSALKKRPHFHIFSLAGLTAIPKRQPCLQPIHLREKSKPRPPKLWHSNGESKIPQPQRNGRIVSQLEATRVSWRFWKLHIRG